MIFQYASKQVLIQRILIGLETMVENIISYFCRANEEYMDHETILFGGDQLG